MRYFSCFSGIEAASVAWHPLGWTPVGFSEIDPFASAVLAHRFPEVKNYGDITKHHEWDIGPGSVDVLVGGSPCQAFSVAGLRRGLDDPRGQLTLVYLQLAARLEPEWIVWENVPGVLSADGGRAFGAFLGALAELGYGFAWRVLDARHFGVPQRRRRVFLVARRAGDWRSCAEILLEPAGLRWNPAQGRETWEAAATRVADCARAGITYGGSQQDFSNPVTAKWGKQSGGPAGDECGLYVAHPSVPDVSATLNGQSGGQSLCNQPVDEGAFIPMLPKVFGEGSFANYDEGKFSTLRRSGGTQGGGSETIVTVAQAADVRTGRLTGDVSGTICAKGSGGWSNHMINPVLVPHAFYSTGGTHGLEPNPNVSPPLKVGSTLGIPSPPAVAFTIDMQGCKGNANVGDGTLSPTLGRPSGTDCHAVAIPIDGRNAMRDAEKRDEVNRQGVGVGVPGDPAHTVTTACVHAVAFSCKEDASDASDIAPTLRAMSHDQSHANGGGQLAIAFKPGASAKSRSIGASLDCAPTLESGGGGNNKPAVAVGVDVYNQQMTGDTAATVTSATGVANASGPKVMTPFRKSKRAQSSSDDETWVDAEHANTLNGYDTGDVRTTHAVTAAMVVRRLLPVECERLQGFPDGWTEIPYRGKAAPDGPRYKALGNSMAVPCMAWIGRRIQASAGSSQ